MTTLQRLHLHSPETNFQREFLKLAGTYLACRLRVLGGDIERMTIPAGDLRFSLLGMTDHSGEMRLLCQEALGALKIAEGAPVSLTR